MSVKVSIFYPALKQAIGNPTEVRVNGTTVGECLADLIRPHPEAERLLFDSRGRLLRPVYVYVNREGMFKADLDQPVADDDVLIIAVLASAG